MAAKVFLDTTRPTGASTLQVHSGTPQADTVFPFTGVTRVRIYDDGALVGLDDAGASVVYLTPGTYWGYLWT